VEFATGDTVTLELNLDKQELTFLVGGKRAGPRVRNVQGDLYPAVFISGDEGDCVVLVKAEVVSSKQSISVHRSFAKIVGIADDRHKQARSPDSGQGLSPPQRADTMSAFQVVTGIPLQDSSPQTQVRIFECAFFECSYVCARFFFERARCWDTQLEHASPYIRARLCAEAQVEADPNCRACLAGGAG